MLILGARLLGAPVMGLQTGSQLASAERPIIDPRNLTIVAYEVEGQLLSERPSFIRINEIRELSDIGMIIDSSDEFIGEHDVIKIKELYDLAFNLIGMRVLDERRHKLGKVEDYVIDTDNFTIQQLTVQGGIFKSLSSTGHVVHRSQIVEINNSEIIVKSTEKKLTSLETAGAIHRTYSNPFRKSPEQQPESRDVT